MNAVIRPINYDDVADVASIHAASWRSAYRGILRDEFLDGDLVANRTEVWERRLSSLSTKHFGYLAVDAGQSIGFVFAFGEQDDKWGTLIDNLHVLPSHKGRGLGKRLLASLCVHASTALPDVALYLWVFEQNTVARKFYESMGGELVERTVTVAPGGGEVAEWRCVWPSAGRMLEVLNR